MNDKTKKTPEEVFHSAYVWRAIVDVMATAIRMSQATIMTISTSPPITYSV
jgi:hypothetical protein